MSTLYSFPFVSGFIFSLFLNWVLIKVSEKSGLVFNFRPARVRGQNASSKRTRNVSRLGGVAIILSFILATIIDRNLVLTNHLFGFLAGGILVLFVGVADDFLDIRPGKQLFFQLLISLGIILSGIRVDYFANPLGGVIRLDSVEIFGFSLFGSIFVFFWIIFLMNVLNWADGLDGLAGGTGAIGAVALFFLSVSPIVNQPPLGIISIALLGSILGFLFFNFHPAKIFMGTSGAMFIGFALAVISIFSGAKLATLALVLSVPILDALWVIIQRIKNKKSIFKGDYSHLHYRLLALGFSERRIIIFYYIIAAVFGLLALNMGSLGKIITLVSFSVLMTGILIGISLSSERYSGRERTEKK